MIQMDAGDPLSACAASAGESASSALEYDAFRCSTAFLVSQEKREPTEHQVQAPDVALVVDGLVEPLARWA